MNNLRPSLIKTRINSRPLTANGAIIGATSRVGSVRTSIMQNRAYSSDRPKKGGAGGLKLLSKHKDITLNDDLPNFFLNSLAWSRWSCRILL